jgi:hypothetical protein
MSLGSTLASNRNGCQGSSPEGEDGRCVGLTVLPFSCADCHSWELRLAGTLGACLDLCVVNLRLSCYRLISYTFNLSSSFCPTFISCYVWSHDMRRGKTTVLESLK